MKQLSVSLEWLKDAIEKDTEVGCFFFDGKVVPKDFCMGFIDGMIEQGHELFPIEEDTNV